MTTTLRAIATAFCLLAFAGTAQAACYEDLGQTGCPDQELFPLDDLRRLSCQNLWYVRNQIYNEHGYCFRTPAAIEQFDNSDCFVRDAGQLRLNEYERENIARIVRVERELACR